ncbi:diaminopimelate decarboxylase [soil metagenome]
MKSTVSGVTSAYEERAGRLIVGRAPVGAGDLSKLLANYETPFFFYNLDHVAARAELMKSALVRDAGLPAAIHYALKANANPRVLKTLKRCGLEVDVVSAGEADCAVANGFEAKDILFSGVAKTVKELRRAITLGVKQINVESLGELERLEQIVLEMKPSHPVSIGLRLNPNVSPETHPYITTGLKENKFGLEEDAVFEAVDRIANTTAALLFRGLSLHIGSQLLELSALGEALEIGIAVQRKIGEKLGPRLAKSMDRFDAGGGIGINYDSIDETTECEVISKYAHLLKKYLAPEIAAGRTRELLVEPGRWLVARAGLLITEVQYTKVTQHKSFVIVDGGMNLLIRPALYEAEHRIAPLVAENEAQQSIDKKIDIVGPICESADFLGRDRTMKSVKQGDRLAAFDAGAYGRTMASNYNQRGWPAEYVYQNGIVDRADSL